MNGLKSAIRATWLILLAACGSKWNAVGVTDPIEIRMMDEWERRGLGSDTGLQEWAIENSPKKRFAVIYRLYWDHPDCQTTHTYFRIEGSVPVFVRHDVWPGMCYNALQDDGSAVVLQFNHAALRWIAVDPIGRKQSGMLLHNDAEIEAGDDGSFLLKTGLADYRIRTCPGEPPLTRERFREDARFFDNGTLDGYASLPEGLSKEDETRFRAHLVELMAANQSESRGAKYIRTYAKAALSISDWPSRASVPMPAVRQLLGEIAEKQ